MAKTLKEKIKVSVYNQNIKNLIDICKPLIPQGDIKLLDIGCNDCVYTRMYCREFGIPYENSYGIDYNLEAVNELNSLRFFYHDLDSMSPMPFKEKVFDLIIMNQVLEHTKNIGYILCDINRISKNGALLAISVPNLAALHNRFFLLFGKMPLAVQGMDHHVRGFTIKALKDFIEGYGFEYVTRTGGGMYPFWGRATGLLGRCFPQFSVFFTLLFNKREDYDISKLQNKVYHVTQLDGQSGTAY